MVLLWVLNIKIFKHTRSPGKPACVPPEFWASRTQRCVFQSPSLSVSPSVSHPLGKRTLELWLTSASRSCLFCVWMKDCGLVNTAAASGERNRTLPSWTWALTWTHTLNLSPVSVSIKPPGLLLGVDTCCPRPASSYHFSLCTVHPQPHFDWFTFFFFCTGRGASTNKFIEQTWISIRRSYIYIGLHLRIQVECHIQCQCRKVWWVWLVSWSFSNCNTSRYWRRWKKNTNKKGLKLFHGFIIS